MKVRKPDRTDRRARTAPGTTSPEPMETVLASHETADLGPALQEPAAADAWDLDHEQDHDQNHDQDQDHDHDHDEGQSPAGPAEPESLGAALARLEQEHARLHEELARRTAWALTIRARLDDERRRRLVVEQQQHEALRNQQTHHSVLPDRPVAPRTEPSTSEAPVSVSALDSIDDAAASEPELRASQEPLVELRQLAQAFEEELLPLRREAGRLDQACRQYRADLSLTRTRLEHALNEVARLREQVAAFDRREGERQALEQHLKRIEAEGRQIPGLLAQLRQMEEENQQVPALRKQVDDLEARAREIPALREAITRYQQEAARIPELIRTIRRLETEVRELELLRTRAGRLEARVREIPVLTQRIRQLEAAADDAEHRAMELHEELVDRKAELDTWQRCLRRSNLHAPSEAAAPHVVARRLEEVGRLEERIAELERALAATEAARAAAAHQAREIAGSTTWRATAPLRRLLDLIRRR